MFYDIQWFPLQQSTVSESVISRINHSEGLLPSNVKSTLYKSGRRSRNTPQLCLLDLILSRSNLAMRTASSLSSAAATISPVGPVHQIISSTYSSRLHVHLLRDSISFFFPFKGYLLWMSSHKMWSCYLHALSGLFPSQCGLKLQEVPEFVKRQLSMVL